MTTIREGVEATLRGWHPSALSRDAVASCQRDEGVDVPRNTPEDPDAEQRWRAEQFDPEFDAMIADGTVVPAELVTAGEPGEPGEPQYTIAQP